MVKHCLDLEDVSSASIRADINENLRLFAERVLNRLEKLNGGLRCVLLTWILRVRLARASTSGVSGPRTEEDQTERETHKSGPFVAQSAFVTLHQRLYDGDGDVTVTGSNENVTQSQSSH
jgi:hypothetical protein